MQAYSDRVLRVGGRLLEAISDEGRLNRAYSENPSPTMLQALMEIRRSVERITAEYLDAVTGSEPDALSR